MPSKSKTKTGISVAVEHLEIVVESSIPLDALTKGKEDAGKPLYLKRV
jgi:hypothetical protein